MTERKVERVAAVLRRVVRGLELEKGLESHSLDGRWEVLVGARLAAHTRPTRVRTGELVVEARSAVWLQELALQRTALLEAIRRQLPNVRVDTIRLRLGGGFPPAAPERRPVTASPTEVALARAELEREGAREGALLAARALALSRSRR